MKEFTPNPLFEFLHDQKYKLDGVMGFFSHEVREVRYPYRRMEEKLIHRPNAAGKHSDAYRAVKETLGDDYVTDLTDSIERFVSIAVDLGYRVPPLD